MRVAVLLGLAAAASLGCDDDVAAGTPPMPDSGNQVDCRFAEQACAAGFICVETVAGWDCVPDAAPDATPSDSGANEADLAQLDMAGRDASPADLGPSDAGVDLAPPDAQPLDQAVDMAPLEPDAQPDAAVVDAAPEPDAALPPPVELDWVQIEGGEYQMYWGPQINLPDFEITRTEVQVGQYRACVDAGVCTPPATENYNNLERCLVRTNWGRPLPPDPHHREDHPVNCISKRQAEEFAEWVGARLPSEAEWEFVARSRGQQRTYIWGNSPVPDCNLTVMNGNDGWGCGLDATWPACSRAGDTTDQGVCDMSGNVGEYLADYFHAEPVGGPPNDGSPWLRPPTNLWSSRGGSLANSGDAHRIARRARGPGDEPHFAVGFRLVRRPE